MGVEAVVPPLPLGAAAVLLVIVLLLLPWPLLSGLIKRIDSPTH